MESKKGCDFAPEEFVLLSNTVKKLFVKDVDLLRIVHDSKSVNNKAKNQISVAAPTRKPTGAQKSLIAFDSERQRYYCE